MADRRLNHILLLLGVVTAVSTIGNNLISVGNLKGVLTQAIATHEARLNNHENKIEALGESISDIKARIHGIASQVGKVPGKVAAKINEAQSQAQQ